MCAALLPLNDSKQNYIFANVFCKLQHALINFAQKGGLGPLNQRNPAISFQAMKVPMCCHVYVW